MANLPCNCIKGFYNCTVKAVDLETIIYQDLSIWMEDANYQVPQEYTVKVSFPGRSEKVAFTANTKCSVSIPKDVLGCLLDGIYCFEVESCGVTYNKNVAIFPNLRCCLKQAKIEKWEEYKDEIRDIDAIIESVEASSSIGSFQTAAEGLKIAKAMLDNLHCDCNCPCGAKPS